MKYRFTQKRRASTVWKWPLNSRKKNISTVKSFCEDWKIFNKKCRSSCKKWSPIEKVLASTISFMTNGPEKSRASFKKGFTVWASQGKGGRVGVGGGKYDITVWLFCQLCKKRRLGREKCILIRESAFSRLPYKRRYTYNADVAFLLVNIRLASAKKGN